MLLSTATLKLNKAVRIDLARFLLPYNILPRRWRSSLFSARPSRTTQTVCSTMIAEAFGHLQFPILPLVAFSDGLWQ